jgi:hypothetical protein
MVSKLLRSFKKESSRIDFSRLLFLARLECLAHKLMKIEVGAKVGTRKSKHTKMRPTYFAGTRVERLDTRLVTIYLFIPKLVKGVDIPFFISHRQRKHSFRHS